MQVPNRHLLIAGSTGGGGEGAPVRTEAEKMPTLGRVRRNIIGGLLLTRGQIEHPQLLVFGVLPFLNCQPAIVGGELHGMKVSFLIQERSNHGTAVQVPDLDRPGGFFTSSTSRDPPPPAFVCDRMTTVAGKPFRPASLAEGMTWPGPGEPVPTQEDTGQAEGQSPKQGDQMVRSAQPRFHARFPQKHEVPPIIPKTLRKECW